MATIVSVHAHPDDESIISAGFTAKAAEAGHRCVLVVATRGELGTPAPDSLADGESLSVRRTAETHEAARILGYQRVEFLGFVDSGMAGDATNEHPWSFAAADVDHAARRLAVILDEERPEVVVGYDHRGNYGHPDHVQVHHVARRAAVMGGVPHLLEATMSRDHIKRGMDVMADLVADAPAEDRPTAEELDNLGLPEDEITHSVDVTPWVGQKRSAMAAHRSQIAETHFFLAMDEVAFAYAMGIEWFVHEGPDPVPGSVVGDLLTPLR